MANEALPIIHTINQGGSRAGWSHYSSYLGCPKAAALKEEHGGPMGLDTYSAAGVGILGHKFLELHFSRALSDKISSVDVLSTAIEFSDVIDDRVRAEAERCFRSFRTQYPELDIFGDVEGVECPFSTDDTPAIADKVGVSPFTGRIDLVTRQNEAHFDRIMNRFDCDGHLGMWKPGMWIIDYKHYGARWGNLLEKALSSQQYTAYQLAAAALFGEPIAGAMQVSIFNVKEPAFRITVIPPPDSKAKARLARSFEEALINKASPRAIPSEANCFAWGKVCWWRRSGHCDGY